MTRHKHLTVVQRVRRAVIGIACLGFCVLALVILHSASSAVHFEPWNTRNIQPYLTGNVALDEQIITQARYSNDTMSLMIAGALCGFLSMAGVGIWSLYTALRPTHQKTTRRRSSTPRMKHARVPR